MVARLKSLNRPIEDISFLSKHSQRSRVTGIKFGKLVLHESQADAVAIKTTIDPEPSFTIPLLGGVDIIENSESIALPAVTHITAFSADRPKEFHAAKLHVLGIRPDIQELGHAVSSIIGHQGDLAEIMSLNRTVAYPGRIGGTDYVEQILALVAVVNGTRGDLSLLNRIGIAGIFTRVLAEFLVESVTGAPLNDPPIRTTRSKAAVDIICSHIEGNVGTPLTVVKMEELSGMTGRSLNYAFHERFNCSPQQWQRRYLLDLARTRLLDRDDLTSVKAIAYDLGFASSSSFTSHYSRRFGERPSETRANSQAVARKRPTETMEND